MDRTRRKVLLALSGTAVVGGTAVGTGAFDAVSANRTASVAVVTDADTYLALRPIGDPGSNPEGTGPYDGLKDDGNFVRKENPYARIDDGTLQLSFDGPAGTSADGLNGSRSESRFHNVFSITNQGTQTVKVSTDAVPKGDNSADMSAVTLYDSNPDGASVDVNDFSDDLDQVEGHTLDVGEHVAVGVAFDPGVASHDDNAELDKFDSVAIKATETTDTTDTG